MRILEIFGEPISYGGQESFIYNIYKNLSDKNQYFFCTPFHADNTELMELLEEKKDKLINYNFPFESKLRKYYIVTVAIREISSNYDIVHIHSGSIFSLLLIALVSKIKKVPKIVVHSHATGYNTLFHRIIRGLANVLLFRVADLFLACSKLAGEDKYSRKILEGENFFVIKNGIDIDKYSFNPLDREKYRKKLSLSGKTVICNVGRFSHEKNQTYILKVFAEYLKMNPSSHLLLIGGEGNEEQRLYDEIIEYCLNEHVTVLKNRADVPQLLSASDVFIFPSLFEGFGIAAIEAQISGLPTLCGDHLPIELAASKNYFALSIESEPIEWAKMIQKCATRGRLNCINEIIQNGFDVKDCSKILEELYEGRKSNNK